MSFLNSTQKASGLIDMCIPHVAYDDERVSLLDQLEGYNTKYTSPKAANANSVDKGIKLQEKSLIGVLEHLDALNVAELLQTTDDP